MIGVVIATVSGVTLVAAWLFKNIISALMVQEVKGALAERLQRDTDRAAAAIVDEDLRDELRAEWLGEMAAAKDRPLKAVFLVRGYKTAARSINADTAPVPASDHGPSFTKRFQQRTVSGAASVLEIARRVARFREPILTLGTLTGVLIWNYETPGSPSWLIILMASLFVLYIGSLLLRRL